MSVFAELPDGRKLEFPDGTDPAVIQQTVKKVLGAPPAEQAPQQAPATTAEKIAGNPITRFALGAAAPVIGGAQFLANVSPIAQASGEAKRINDYVAQLEQMKQRGMEASDNSGMDVTGLVGSLMNPAGLAAGKVITAAPKLWERVKQGVSVGGATGATAPVTQGDFEEEKTTQIGLGVTAGAVIPLAIGAMRAIGGTARDVADLIIPGGAQRIFEKYQDKIIGAAPDVRQRIITALRAAEEYVKGSKPTAAEAVADIPQASPILSYQNIVAATPGGPSGAFGQRMADQEGARRAALQTIGKTPADLAAAEQARKVAAQQNYGVAFSKELRADPTLATLSKDPFFQKALPDALDLAKSRGVDPKENLTEFLHFVKIGLDRQLLPNANNALTSTQQSAITGVREKLLGWLKQPKNNPAYDEARRKFAEQSKEIDRMRIGQSLEEKLVSATEKETPASFAQAVRNAPQTIKRATGEPRYEKLSEVLEPGELETVGRVLADVTRRSKAFNQPQRTNLYGGVNVAEETRPRLPNLLSRPAMIANFLLSAGGQRVEKEIDKLATDAYLNPSKLADILDKMPASQKNRLLDILQQTQPQMIAAPVYGYSQGQ